MNPVLCSYKVTKSTSYIQAVKNDHVSAFYPLNETTGTVATDLSGNNLNGTYEGTFTLSSAALGRLPGSFFNTTGSGQVNISAAAALISSSMSFEIWSKAVSYNQTNGNGSNSGASFLNNVQGPSEPTVGFDFGIALTYNSAPNAYWFWPASMKDVHSPQNTAPSTGTLAHNVITINNGTINFYTNGVLILSQTGQTNPSANSLLYLARQGWVNGAWNGTLGRAALYNYPLNIQQIKNHYNIGLG
jgi:hypothetical protein